MPIVKNGRTLLTYEDYVRIPEDRDRHEIIGGRHFVTPSPSYRHQKCSQRIHHQLYESIELAGRGDVCYAPLDVLLSEIDVVQPDILVILRGGGARIEERCVRGAPDLAVEVLSPSTRERDRGLKKDLYEARGVREYWIVDPEARRVEAFDLVEGRYVARPLREDRVQVAVVPDLVVDLKRVW